MMKRLIFLIALTSALTAVSGTEAKAYGTPNSIAYLVAANIYANQQESLTHLTGASHAERLNTAKKYWDRYEKTAATLRAAAIAANWSTATTKAYGDARLNADVAKDYYYSLVYGSRKNLGVGVTSTAGQR